MQSGRFDRRDSFLAVAWDEKRSFDRRPVPSSEAYHEFNLSELATPNFYLGHIGLDVIELRGSSARSARNLWSPHHLL